MTITLMLTNVPEIAMYDVHHFVSILLSLLRICTLTRHVQHIGMRAWAGCITVTLLIKTNKHTGIRSG